MGLTLAAICLTVTSAMAQSGNDCKPSTITNVAPSCPSITDYGAIDATSFCVNQGSDPTMPQLADQPAASDGTLTTTTTTTASDCSTTTTTSTSPINYSFSGLQYNPAPPTKSSRPGTYQSDCFITVTSSDTNDCPPPGNIDYGNVTWNVINTNATTVVFDFNKIGTYFGQILGLIENTASAAGCSSTNSPSFGGTITASWKQVCCNSTNGPYKQSSVTGTITANWPVLQCGIPGASINLPMGICQIGLYGGFGFSGSASATLGVAQPCQTQPVIVNLSVNATIQATLQAVVSVPDGWATCSASASGSCSANVATSQDSDGNCYINGNVGALTVQANVALHLIGGVSCQLFQRSKPLWGGVKIGPIQTDCIQINP